MKRSRYLTLLVVLISFVTIATHSLYAGEATPQVSDRKADADVRDYYAGNGLLNRGYFDLAAIEYRKFLSSNPQHEKAYTARYGLAVSLFRTDNYTEAISELNQLRDDSNSEYATEISTMLGQCHLALNQHIKAASVFQDVVAKHQSHDLADDAAVGAAEAFYSIKQYEDAIAMCQWIAKNTPTSEHRDRAKFFWSLASIGRGNYKAAAGHLAQLISRSPSGAFSDQAEMLLAQCHEQTGQTLDARRQYDTVLKKNHATHTPMALLGLGRIAFQSKKLKEAAKYLDQLLLEFPSFAQTVEAKVLRARVWFEEKNYASAQGMLTEVVKSKTGPKAEATYWLAKCDLRMENFDKAEGRLAQAIKDFPTTELLPEIQYDHAVALVRGEKKNAAISALQAFLTKFAGHGLVPNVLHLLANLELEQGRSDECIRYANTFISTHPEHKLASAMLFISGEAHSAAKKTEKAVVAYGRLVAEYPKSSRFVAATYRLGIIHYQLGELERASSFLEQVIQDGANDFFATASQVLGDIHFQRNEWKQAEAYFRTFLKQGSDSPSEDDTFFKLCVAVQRQERSDEALKLYDNFLVRYKESAHKLQALFERGQILVTLNRASEASDMFRQVIALDSDSQFAAYSRNHLGVIAMQQKDYTAAAEQFSKLRNSESNALSNDALFQEGQALLANDKFSEAAQAFAQFLKLHASDKRAGLAAAQLAVCFSKQDEYEKALSMIQQATKTLKQGDEADWRPTLLYEKAWCLRKLNRTRDAAAAYRRFLALGRTDAMTAHSLLDLSGIEYENDQFDSAVTLLEKLRNIASSDAVSLPREILEQAVYRQAVCQFKLERFREAANLLSEFSSSFPASELMKSACFFAGEAFYELGEHAAAEKYFGLIVDKFSTSKRLEVALLRRGQCQAATQQWALAEKTFSQHLSRFPQSEHSYQAQFGLGWARENQRNLNDAIKVYQRVVDTHTGPTAARAQFQIGECLFADKQYADAVRALLKVDILYAYPEWSAAALYEAGRCFEMMGKTVEARAQFKAVMEKYDGTKWAELASQKISQLASGVLPGR